MNLMSENCFVKSSRYQMACRIYPVGSKEYRWRRGVFCWRSLRYKKYFSNLRKLFELPGLSIVANQYPRILEKAFRPYLYRGLKPSECTKMLGQHYGFLQQYCSVSIMRAVYSQAGLELLSIQDEQREMVNFKVCLHYMDDFEKEGELILSLFDAKGHRFYSVVFSIIQLNDQRTMAIGCLQGAKPKDIPDADARIKQLTRHLFGLRPKALMLELALMLARTWQCEQVVGVRNQAHMYQSYSKKNQRVKTDYDRLWLENKGEILNAHFIRLPVAARRKALSEIKSQKRSQYRSRYAWLEQAQERIKDQLAL